MRLHYFALPGADDDDVALGAAKIYGYVPTTCLLGGAIVWANVAAGNDPCAGCHGPRQRCGGRPFVAEKDLALDREARRLYADLLGDDPIARLLNDQYRG